MDPKRKMNLERQVAEGKKALDDYFDENPFTEFLEMTAAGQAQIIALMDYAHRHTTLRDPAPSTDQVATMLDALVDLTRALRPVAQPLEELHGLC